jgi:hypothetical protein
MHSFASVLRDQHDAVKNQFLLEIYIMTLSCGSSTRFPCSVASQHRPSKKRQHWLRAAIASIAGGGIALVSAQATAQQFINLSSLNGTNGFKMTGVASGDLTGACVSELGDINGDGFADIAISAGYAGTSPNEYGSAFVVFGAASGFPTTLDLNTLNGSNGFRLNGSLGEYAGNRVSAAGDINGDGFDDIAIGCRFAPVNGPASGTVYVVFGKASGFTPVFQLSTVNGSNGFKLNGASGNQAGFGLACAGDINGDGIDDLIIGAPFTDFNADNAGSAFVVFGRTTSFDGVTELSDLNGTTGFRLNGVAADDLTGVSVDGAGDVNNDGVDDVVIGAMRASPNGTRSGKTYIIFGRAGLFMPVIELSGLIAANGIKINGAAAFDYSGARVSGAGDVNGDGFADVIIGAQGVDTGGSYNGAAYVVFGKQFLPDTIELSVLNGINGFTLNGTAPGGKAGLSVSEAGDVNGDGISDVIASAPEAATPAGGAVGETYVVFGNTAGFSANLGFSALDGTNGFTLRGEGAANYCGEWVSSAGDMNGDGAADIIIGAPDVGAAGAAYVVFGPTNRLNVDKMKISLNFATSGKDSISIKGKIPIPGAFNPAGQKLRFDIGGLTKTYALDSKGSVKASTDSFKLKIKSQNGIVNAQDAPFSLSLKKGDFDSFFADEGLIDADLKSQGVTVRASIYVGNKLNALRVPQLYSAKQGKSGKTK